MATELPRCVKKGTGKKPALRGYEELNNRAVRYARKTMSKAEIINWARKMMPDSPRACWARRVTKDPFSQIAFPVPGTFTSISRKIPIIVPVAVTSAAQAFITSVIRQLVTDPESHDVDMFGADHVINALYDCAGTMSNLAPHMKASDIMRAALQQVPELHTSTWVEDQTVIAYVVARKRILKTICGRLMRVNPVSNKPPAESAMYSVMWPVTPEIEFTSVAADATESEDEARCVSDAESTS